MKQMKNVAHNTRTVAILNFQNSFNNKKKLQIYPMACSFTWGIEILQYFIQKTKYRDTGGSPNFQT